MFRPSPKVSPINGDQSVTWIGWKMNPVEFDSVFNQSRHTWSFGSPDILPMFKHGASDKDKIETFMYSEDQEDFTGGTLLLIHFLIILFQDGSALDTWVFDKFNGLLDKASTDATLNRLLHQDKIVFFLHLLGLDTNGHAHRPHSDECVV
jgi:phosphatidylinositol glycan class N